MFNSMDMNFGQPGADDFKGPYLPEAAECLSCGLCVSACPTYRLFGTEEETPRRRVRTLGKLLSENLPISAEEQFHLDNCLQCRACESVCPSRMVYGPLYDQAQLLLKTKPNLMAKMAFWLIENKRWRRRLMFFLALYLKSGLRTPLRKSGLLNKLKLNHAEALLGKPELQPLAARYRGKAAIRGRVALFSGCLAESFDRETLLSAVKLLNAIGYEIQIPEQQNCCGAIHRHNGQMATGLIDHTIKTFNELDVEALVYTAPGCGAMLSEYQSQNSDEADRFRQRLFDVHDFLLNHWPDDLRLKPVNLTVAVHEPCSQRNVLKNQKSVYSLLEKIPGITAAPLADNHLCCGAGGSYMLTHPVNARQLRDIKRQVMHGSAADLIVSSNFGCLVFLNVGINTIKHPLWLLAQQLTMPIVTHMVR